MLRNKSSFIVFSFLAILLVSCSGNSKVKTLVELTPRFYANENHSININGEFMQDPFDFKGNAFVKYNITGNIIGEPVCAKGKIYILTNDHQIVAFSNTDKKIIWKHKIATFKNQPNSHSGGVLYINGKLFVTDGSRKLTAINADTGYEIFQKTFPNIIRIQPVLFKEEALLIQTIDNEIFAYDTSNDSILWQYSADSSTLSSHFRFAPIVHDNHLITSDNNGNLISVNIVNMSVAWIFNMEDSYSMIMANLDGKFITCKPEIDNKYLYFATSNGRLVKLDLVSGQISWEANINDVQSMYLLDNYLFITTNARQVIALDISRGDVIWAGNLYSSEDKTLRPVEFLRPFISQSYDDDYILNVIGNNGALYQFSYSDSKFNVEPSIVKITKNIQYIGYTCCSNMFLITDKAILFAK
ncbi:MAG: PQQ-binding-like beta-propeller repeat protein [Rickettsiaceae bacterium]